MKSRIEYKGGMHFSGKTPSGHEIHWDSGPKDIVTKGATPMESLLQAGAVCSAMDVVAILKKRRKEPVFFELEVEGDRVDEYPKIFKYIRIVYRIGGDGISHDEVEKAVKLSQEKYCSIINMIRPKVQVEYRIEMV